MTKIRDMKESDIEAIHKIGISIKEFEVSPNMKGFWSKEQIKNWIKSKNDVMLVAEDEGIVGFIMAVLHKPTGKATIENLWVDKNQRGKNLGSKLLKVCIKKLKKNGCIYVNAMTKVTNSPITKFLQKNGFDKGYDFYWMGIKI